MTSAPTDNPFAGIARFRRRSEMYRWLRQHYEMVRETLAVDQPTWQAIADRMATAGLVDSKGRAPRAENVRKTWTRVCRDIAATPDEVKGAPLARQNPSRFARTWRPPIAPEKPPLPASGAPGPPPTVSRQKMRVLRGLGDVQPATESTPIDGADPESSTGVGILPPARWPKPFN